MRPLSTYGAILILVLIDSAMLMKKSDENLSFECWLALTDSKI